MSETRSGYRSSMSGLVGALLVSLALIGCFFAFSFFQRGSSTDPAPTVDYTGVLAQARSQAPFPVLAPTSLPAGWRATSVDWSGSGPENSWHLGLLTSQDAYVGLEQGNATAQSFISEHTRANQPGAPVQIAGQTWQTLTAGSETALVLTGEGVTTVVTGTASESQLVAFAASLSAS
ncbi:MAG: DUF4245 domain-containing protein [Nocardioidaceae bacterium]